MGIKACLFCGRSYDGVLGVASPCPHCGGHPSEIFAEPGMDIGEFDTDLERAGIESWLAADPILPLTHTAGVTDWLDVTKGMGISPIRWSL